MRSRTRKLQWIVWGAVAAVLALFRADLQACGPFYPTWLLGPEDLVLHGPVGTFRDEIARLPGLPVATVRSVLSEEAPETLTAEVDLEELRTALLATGLPDDALLSRYTEVRHALMAHASAMASWNSWQSYLGERPSPPELPELEVPPGLPAEFDLYLRGAVAYHRQDFEEARRHWEKLLELAPGERHLRSTWAAYMLGRSAVEQSPETAVERFEQVRKLAADGFADPLGLAAASLGWQARAERDLERPALALRLYAEQFSSGDDRALTSLRWTANDALHLDAEKLVELARLPDVRGILSAALVAGHFDTEVTAKWLDAAEDAGVDGGAGAERLAWAAYLKGDFEGARTWLARSSDEEAITHWLRAKLLLRDGRLDEAAQELATASRLLPPVELDVAEAFDREIDQEEDLTADGRRVLGERGAVQLSRGELREALDFLLRGGYRLDAAYVAERVLTVDELAAYVDAEWPADLAQTWKETGWNTSVWGNAPAGRVAYEVRALLGRRLARAGRFDAARGYLPAPLATHLDTYAKHLTLGHDAAQSERQRGEALWEAARVLRTYGMELFGTELEPDWAAFDGNLQPDFLVESRQERDTNPHLTATDDEKQRYTRSAAQPPKRYHYRYLAADLAWEAAGLLPDGDEVTAGVLCTAGSWLKARDPQAADRFFKALVRRCPDTEVGRQAAQRNWFPDSC